MSALAISSNASPSASAMSAPGSPPASIAGVRKRLGKPAGVGKQPFGFRGHVALFEMIDQLGGALALGFARRLEDAGLRHPAEIVLDSGGPSGCRHAERHSAGQMIGVGLPRLVAVPRFVDGVDPERRTTREERLPAGRVQCEPGAMAGLVGLSGKGRAGRPRAPRGCGLLGGNETLGISIRIVTSRFGFIGEERWERLALRLGNGSGRLANGLDRRCAQRLWKPAGVGKQPFGFLRPCRSS